jgi:cell division protein FtsB
VDRRSGTRAGRAAPTSLKRIFLLLLVGAIAVSYVGPVRGYLGQRDELRRQQLALIALEAKRDRLANRLDSLRQVPVLEARARELGMFRPGERAFRVVGLERRSPRPAPKPAATGGRSGIFSWIPRPF